MKYTLIYSLNAENDLNGIFDYIAADNPSRAVSYIDEMEAAIKNLILFPFMGREVRGKRIAVKQRRLIFGNYKIIYEVRTGEKQVYIKSIEHGAKDEKEDKEF